MSRYTTGFTPEERKRMLKLYEENNIKQKALSTRFGCSTATISQQLKKARSERDEISNLG